MNFVNSIRNRLSPNRLLIGLFALTLPVCLAASANAQGSFAKTIEAVQPKMVKIYGAGGVRGLEPYQSGFLISANGHILTTFSYVLDTDYITVTLDDGVKYQGELLGYDPRSEIAVLKIDTLGAPHFDLEDIAKLRPGSRVLAFSNIYGVATGDEPTSVLHGSVSAVAPITARRGAYKTPFKGDIYVLDAMTNNPGGAGGALTDGRGKLAGILGKELRNSANNTWLNYSLPIEALAVSIDKIIRGETIPLSEDTDQKTAIDPLTLELLGINLVPDVLPKTPPFIDKIERGSFAEKAGLRVDDLILFCNDRIVPSCEVLRNELIYIDRDDSIELIIQRDQELVSVKLGIN